MKVYLRFDFDLVKWWRWWVKHEGSYPRRVLCGFGYGRPQSESMDSRIWGFSKNEYAPTDVYRYDDFLKELIPVEPRGCGHRVMVEQVVHWVDAQGRELPW